MKRTIFLLAAFFLTALLVSCGEKREANRITDGDGKFKVLATVNGAPITEYDVRQSFKRGAHGDMVSPDAIQNVLQALVRSELIYQQSVELGLDKNPGYRMKLQEAEAQLRAFQRQEMSGLYREYIRNKANVTDSEAQEYFGKNSERIRTKFHVWQIFYKGDESRMAEDHKDLESGKSFERVASRRFPNLPKGMKAPWDLGYLYWNQIPESWQGIVDRLEPGQVSDIIKGPGERFWVVKLVDKAVDPKVTFATEREKIVEMLRKRKTEELHDATLGRMREKSKIVFSK